MEKKRILCFGDSLTWGFDPERRIRFPEENRWPQVMGKILGDGFQVIEEGQNGRTIAHDDPAEGEKNGLTYLRPCLESHSPFDLLIIMLGSNDCKQKFSYTAMEIAGEMQIFLEKALSYNHFRCQDRFQILLIAPPLIEESVKDSWLGENFGYDHAVEVSKKIAGWYKQLSETYQICFMNAADYVSASRADGCHLDADGQVRLGRAVASYIQKYIF